MGFDMSERCGDCRPCCLLADANGVINCPILQESRHESNHICVAGVALLSAEGYYGGDPEKLDPYLQNLITKAVESAVESGYADKNLTEDDCKGLGKWLAEFGTYPYSGKKPKTSTDTVSSPDGLVDGQWLPMRGCMDDKGDDFTVLRVGHGISLTDDEAIRMRAVVGCPIENAVFIERVNKLNKEDGYPSVGRTFRYSEVKHVINKQEGAEKQASEGTEA